MESMMNPILEASFHTTSKNNASYKVLINEKYLCIVKTNGAGMKSKVILMDDVIGSRCTRRRRRINEKCECHPNSANVFTFLDHNGVDTTDVSAYLHIYTYTLKDFKITSGRKRERFEITLRFRLYTQYEDNLKEAFKWKKIVKQLISKAQSHSLLSGCLKNIPGDNNKQSRDGKILLIVNPKSGPGKAREIFQEQVLPVLIEAEVEYDLHVTKAQNDARNLMKTSNVLKWRRGIVVIGGDGVLYEVMNGIMERPDWKNIINTIPFGIIPGGSGNGLAKSLAACTREPYDSNPVLISVLNILKGTPVPIDLVRIETQTEVAFSFLSFGWGLLADIDIESERLRMIGSPRFTIWSMARLIGLRTYSGRLSFLRIPEDKVKLALSSHKYVEIQVEDYDVDENNDPKSAGNFDCNSNLSFDMDSISLDTGCNQCENVRVVRSESFYSLNSHKSAYLSADKTASYLSLPEVTKTTKKNTIYGPVSHLPTLNKPVPKSWEVYQGDFVMVHASYQSHLAGDVFFAPSCKPNDGIIWLLVIKAGISRVNLLQFLLGLSSGNHLKLPQIEMIPVFAFRLEPLCKGSHIVVDGEILEHSSAIQAEMFPGIISMLNRSQTEV
ncbi:sphingosine kinase 1-like isoform X2 [Planococcus citri]|uniref:sphingosine kinase 1-like isoform X2 n=1 Tax=Planococcus citri TaxID=170843 RepID=UPI0031F8EC6D